MSYATANGHPVTQAHHSWLELPITGRALAELHLAVAASEAPIEVGERVVLRFQNGTQHQMTATHAGAKAGAWAVRCVAGAGRMASELPARFYQEVEAETIVTDIARELGEAVSALQLVGRYPNYVRMKGAGNAQLSALLDYVGGIGWRFAPDGGLRIAPETWGVVHEARLEQAHSEQGLWQLLPSPAICAGERVRTQYGEALPRKVVHHIGAELATELQL